MAISFPTTSLVANVTTYYYNNKSWIWTGTIWQSLAIGTGSQGLQGIQLYGLQGIQGVRSSQGIQGSQIQGIQAIQGIQGSGFQGIQGPTSTIQGRQGVQGSQIQGIQGIQGSQIQGRQGTTATIQGIQGIQAYTLQGIQGIQGSQIQGRQGTTSVVVGSTGLQGLQGIQGWSIQGIQGRQGINARFQGIQGPIGTQGIQGVQGFYPDSALQVVQLFGNTNPWSSSTPPSEALYAWTVDNYSYNAIYIPTFGTTLSPGFTLSFYQGTDTKIFVSMFASAYTYVSGGALGATSVTVSTIGSDISPGMYLKATTGITTASLTTITSIVGNTINFTPAASAQISGSIIAYPIGNSIWGQQNKSFPFVGSYYAYAPFFSTRTKGSIVQCIYLGNDSWIATGDGEAF